MMGFIFGRGGVGVTFAVEPSSKNVLSKRLTDRQTDVGQNKKKKNNEQNKKIRF